MAPSCFAVAVRIVRSLSVHPHLVFVLLFGYQDISAIPCQRVLAFCMDVNDAAIYLYRYVNTGRAHSKTKIIMGKTLGNLRPEAVTIYPCAPVGLCDNTVRNI